MGFFYFRKNWFHYRRRKNKNTDLTKITNCDCVIIITSEKKIANYWNFFLSFFLFSMEWDIKEEENEMKSLYTFFNRIKIRRYIWAYTNHICEQKIYVPFVDFRSCWIFVLFRLHAKNIAIISMSRKINATILKNSDQYNADYFV